MILITGASSGIGQACAEAFAGQGRSLILIARRQDRLETLKSQLLTKHPNIQVVTVCLDLRDGTAVQAWVKNNTQWISQVEVLINNAGLARGMELFQEGNFEDWQEMIDTNLTSVLTLTRLVLPHFLKRPETPSKTRGHIVFLGSVAGRWNYPRGNIYCATKAAIHALTESLRIDLVGTGVRVTEIAPGMVETEFSAVRFRNDHERAKQVYRGMTPLNAHDIAETVLWTVNRPAHVNIQEIVLYPTDQASPTLVNRKE